MAQTIHKKHWLLRQRQNFDKALIKIIQVDYNAIDKRLNNRLSAEKLALLVTATDKDFTPLLTQYCAKSGRKLKTVSIEDLQIAIAINGRDTTLETLKRQVCSQYAPEWLHTEPKALNKLMVYDPHGYFIYAASHIFHNDIITVSNIPKSQPSPVITDEKDLSGLFEELSFINAIDKPQNLQTFEMPADADIRYFNYQDKYISRQKLYAFCDVQKITKANELLRRFLGLCNPIKAAKFCKFSFQHLHEITESEKDLEQFITELQNNLKELFIHHFKHKKITHLNKEQIAKLKAGKVDFSDIATIKAKYSGLTNFHQQSKIKNLTKRQSLEHELAGFFNLKALNNPDLMRVQYGHKIEQPKTNRYTVESSTGFKLKLPTKKD